MSRFLCRVVSALGVAATAFAAGCVDPTPDHFPRPRDAGSHEPVDAAVVADLAGRYVALADVVATERCRCAGDVALCRRENRADWDANGRACVEHAVALDVPGYELVVPCLEAAGATFVDCHDDPVQCADVDARQACTDSFTADGNACFGSATDEAQVALAVCRPSTPDAGP